MRRGLFTVLVTVLLLASVASADQLTTRKPRRQAKKDRKRHAEPDPSKPQRKFRGGRVRHPMFEGSGCPESSVLLVNASDTSSFALSALFSQFQAQTTGTELRDRKTCTITVVLEPEANMSIGVAHVDFRGSAYVPVSSAVANYDVHTTTAKAETFAKLKASYKVTGARREPAIDRTFDEGFDDFVYEAAEVDPVVWTPCDASSRRERVFEFRIKATITAAKASAQDTDVMIAVDTSDSTLQKGLYYQLTTRPCEEVGTTIAPASTTPCPPTETPTETPAPSVATTPVVIPAETPVVTPAETSTGSPVINPAETLPTTPSETPIEKPAPTSTMYPVSEAPTPSPTPSLSTETLTTPPERANCV